MDVRLERIKKKVEKLGFWFNSDIYKTATNGRYIIIFICWWLSGQINEQLGL